MSGAQDKHLRALEEVIAEKQAAEQKLQLLVTKVFIEEPSTLKMVGVCLYSTLPRMVMS